MNVAKQQNSTMSLTITLRTANLPQLASAVQN